MVKDFLNFVKNSRGYFVGTFVLLIFGLGTIYIWNYRVAHIEYAQKNTFEDKASSFSSAVGKKLIQKYYHLVSYGEIITEPFDIKLDNILNRDPDFIKLEVQNTGVNGLFAEPTPEGVRIHMTVPVTNKSGYFLVGTLDSQKFFSQLLAEVGVPDGYVFEIYSNDFLIYSSKPLVQLFGYDLFSSNEIKVFQDAWFLRSYGNSLIIPMNPSMYQEYLYLVIGISVVLVILCVLYFFASSRSKAYKMAISMTEELRSYHARVSGLLQNLPVGVFFADGNTGEGLIMNPTAEKLLGNSLSKIINKQNFTKYFKLLQDQSTEYPIEDFPLFQTISTRKVSEKDDIQRKLSDGTVCFLRIKSAPVIDSEGVMKYVVAIVEDITKERNIDRMKTEFISLASHQLRTPLSAIKWFCEILLDNDAGELTTEQRYYLNNVNTSNNRMIDLVNALLNISRIESGRIIIDPKPTDISEMVDGVIKEIEVKYKSRKQTLKITISQGIPKINIDSKLVRQALLNLLTNAIKYTPINGHISINITFDFQNVLFEVADSGYGIPKEDFDRIFSKFFRASNVIKVETDGTGLGLYLVKSIIESSGGKVWFTSILDKGTTFFFTLPLSGSKPHKGEVTLTM